MLTSVNPATEEIIASYPQTEPAAIEKAMSKALKAQADWKNASFAERAKVLKKIAQQLRVEQKKLALLATQEMGKPLSQSMDEVEKCAKALEFYAAEGAKFLADEKVETDARKSYVSHQPLGVVLAVMPWNFPYWQAFRAIAPILMGGNVLVLKHASNVSGCAVAIEKVILQSGAPKGLFQTLLLPSSEVEKLIAHPATAAVTFTGSTDAGRKIAEAAGRNLKKQVLELGGSDAYIILEDADMKLAVDTCVYARLLNSGQSCVCAKRFVVVKSVRKEFERGMVAKMQASTFGEPNDIDNTIGPLARIDLRDQLHEQVMKSVEMGAKILCGGYIPEGKGAYYPPTVLANVKKGMPAYDEELFGPVAAIIEAKHEQDAVRIANDSIFGLGGAVFSKDKKKAEAIASQQLQAGNCFVNTFVHSDARLPFGGVKQSGYGRELGSYGIREFVNTKTVFVK